MVYPIVKFGDPVLEREADNITDFDTPDLHQLVEDMFDSMYAAKGVGLAAPQIGISKKIAVIDCSNGENPDEKLVLINPQILNGEGKQVGEEGCLSIPKFREQVRRAKRVTARAQNAKGEEFEITGEDLLARALLHEIEHLQGRLYITHLSTLKRDLMKRKIKKLQRSGDWV
ncbi:peptide deformylase [Candidatus Sulfopaludibacter sp. SbA4]|nr:peptide deformylase [Candidatus Sulfopaludibacter sp. SbA4]